MKKILVICYSFPPHPGIGGRRWAKFSKCLAKKDYNIFVVSKQNTSKAKSEWFSDIIAPNIKLFPKNVFYPEVFNSYPTSYINKLIYRFWILFFRLFSPGLLYDRSFFWKKTVNKEVKDLIEREQIKTVIITGPPFKYFYFLARLKQKKNFNFNLILDFRDPWTDNTTFMGLSSLSEKRISFERNLEKFSISYADKVVSANQYNTEILIKKYPEFQSKFITIENGIDLDDYKNIPSQNKESNKIVFTLAGSLYNGTEYIFIPFLTFLLDLKQTSPNFYDQLRFDFYGNVDKKIEALINSSNLDIIKLHGHVEKQEVISAMNRTDYCMIFIAPNHFDNFNTKFYECLALRKPIALFSNEGAISEFLRTHNLGIAIRPETFKEDFTKLLSYQAKTDYNYHFDLSPFTIEALTAKLETILNKV